jgi:hypothetical protein
VWRAASGINPQDPRPTGKGGELDLAAVLWKQRLDRQIARSTAHSDGSRLPGSLKINGRACAGLRRVSSVRSRPRRLVF